MGFWVECVPRKSFPAKENMIGCDEKLTLLHFGTDGEQEKKNKRLIQFPSHTIHFCVTWNAIQFKIASIIPTLAEFYRLFHQFLRWITREKSRKWRGFNRYINTFHIKSINWIFEHPTWVGAHDSKPTNKIVWKLSTPYFLIFILLLKEKSFILKSVFTLDQIETTSWFCFQTDIMLSMLFILPQNVVFHWKKSGLSILLDHFLFDWSFGCFLSLAFQLKSKLYLRKTFFFEKE